MNEDTAKRVLAEHRWKLYDVEDPGLLPDGRVLRRIDEIPHDDVDELVKFLESYVSVTNYDVDSAIRYASVENPKVDKHARTGIWRHVRCFVQRVDRDGRVNPTGTKWRIVQELAEGLLTQLSDAEARLIQTRSNTGDGATNPGAEYLMLEWVGCDPDTAKTLADGKLSTSVVNELKYRKVKHDGTTLTVLLGDGWHVLSATHQLAEDGSGTLRVGFAKPQFTLSGFTNWLGSRHAGLTQYFDVPEALAQGILTAAQGRGADARATAYNRDQGLVSLNVTNLDLTGVTLTDIALGEDCDFVTTGTFTWGTGDNTVLPIPVRAAGESYDRNVSENGDGTFNVSLIKRTRRFRDLDEYTSAHRSDRTEQRKEWKGHTVQNLGTALDAQSGKVVRISKQFNDDCSVNIVREVFTPTSQIEADYLHSHSEAVLRDTQSHADLAAALSNLPTSTPASGEVRRAVVRSDEYGLATLEVESRSGKNQSWTEGETRSDRTSTRTVNTQADAEADPARGVGEDNNIIRVQNRETEFGKHHTEREVISSVNQSWTDEEDRHDQSSVTTRNTHAASEASVPTAASGEIKTAQNRETEFGDFDTTVRTITAKNQSWTEGETRSDRTSTRTVNTQADAEADPARGVGEDNNIIRVQNRETEFGKHHTEREVISSVNQSWTDEEDRHDQSSVTTRNTHAASEASVPTAASGEIKTAQNRETEFGNFDTTERTITAKNQSWTEGETRSDRTSTRTVNTQADAEADPARGVGEDNNIIRVQNRETEFGKHHTEREVITSVNQSWTDEEDRHDQSSVTTRNTHAASEASVPTAASGEIKTVQNRETEFGDFDTTERTITAKNQSWTEGETRSDRTSTRTVNTQADTEADPARGVGEDNNIIRVQNRETEFGKHHTEREVISSVDQASNSYEAGPHRSASIVEHTHAASEVADPGTPAVGTYKRVENEETPFGDHATREVTETQTATDTGWFSAGENQDGTIQRRVATGQTEANAKTIANSAPVGDYKATGLVSGPDKFGHYTATCVAYVDPWSLSSGNPFDEYEQTLTVKHRLWRRIRDASTGAYKDQYRDETRLLKFTGDPREAEVAADLANHYGVVIRPNATGTFFQGQGYTITSNGTWTDA